MPPAEHTPPSLNHQFQKPRPRRHFRPSNVSRRIHADSGSHRQRVTNWPEYDAAPVRRGSLTVWMTEEAIAAWQAPASGKRGGQPIYSAIAIETSLALRLVFHQPLRQTEGLLRSIVSGALTPLSMTVRTVVELPRGMGLRAIAMFDVNDGAKVEFRRVEVLTGPVRRRRWSAEEKARIVEETLAPGARVSEVARRWQVCSQQVFGWRRAAFGL